MDSILSPNHYHWHPVCEAQKISGEFPHHLGAAIDYIWRVGRKGEDPIQDINKAIRHLEFERDRLGATRPATVAAPVASPEHYDDKYDQ